jgi:hypothetical protein
MTKSVVNRFGQILIGGGVTIVLRGQPEMQEDMKAESSPKHARATVSQTSTSTTASPERHENNKRKAEISSTAQSKTHE